MISNEWLRLELRYLVALEAVAAEGSFARAAERLGYTQSAVSQQIAALERAVGQRLVERPGGRRPVSLTEAGELLLRHAEAIMTRLRAARADLDALADGEAGRLRVGTFQSVGVRIVPAVLKRFTQRFPEVELELHEAASGDELLDLVERAELDLAFALPPIREGPFETLELMRDPYVLLVAVGSPLAAVSQPLRPEQLRGVPLVTFRSCANERRVEDRLRSLGIEPQVVFRSDDNGMVQHLAAADMGAALVPLLAVSTDEPGTVSLRLGDTIPARLIGMVWNAERYRSTASRSFAEIAAEVCARLAKRTTFRAGGRGTRVAAVKPGR
jgi:DNA-binding transcriptional LysR family regulator